LTSDGYINKEGEKVTTAKGGSAFVQGLAHLDLGNQQCGYLDHRGRIVFRYSTKPVPPSMLPYSRP
jgi:hypothetical protein